MSDNTPTASTQTAPQDGYPLWNLIVGIASAVVALVVGIPAWNGCIAPAPYFVGDMTINEFALPPATTRVAAAPPLKGYLSLILRSVGSAPANKVKLDLTPVSGV